MISPQMYLHNYIYNRHTTYNTTYVKTSCIQTIIHVCIIYIYVHKVNAIYSVYENFQATRAKVVPVNLNYGSHFSATEVTL